MNLWTALWIVVPLAAVHVLLRRRRALLVCQLLLDLVLVVPGRHVVAGLHLGPAGDNGGAWADAVTVAGSPEQSDLPLQFSVWWSEVRRLAARGEPPWVTDRIGGGVPLFANGQTQVPFPSQLPVWVLGSERGTDVMALWKIELAGLGAALLLLRLRLQPAACALGTVAYAASPYLLSWLVVPLAWVVAAAPWAWWLLLGALRGRRRNLAALATLLGVVAGWSVHAETAGFLWFGLAIHGVILAAGRWRRLRRLVVVFGLALPVAAVGALPAAISILDSSKLQALRAARVYPDQTVSWGVRGRAAALAVVPFRDGHPANGSWRWGVPHAALAIGIAAAAWPALLACGPRRRHARTALGFAAVGVFSVVLVWQVPGPVDVLARAPLLGVMTWARAGFLLPFALAALAAIALDGWLGRGTPARLITAAIVVQLTIITLVVSGSHAGREQVWATAWIPAVVGVLALVRRAKAGWWLAGAVALECILVGWRLVPARRALDPEAVSGVAREARILAAAEPGRFLGVGGALPANLGARFGFADLRAHDPVRPLALARLHRALGATGMDLPGPVTSPWAGLSGAWNVRWLVTPAGGLGGTVATGWQEVYRGDQGMIYRNSRALDEVRLAGAVTASPGDPGTGSWESVDFATTAVVDGLAVVSGSGRLELLERRPSRTIAKVEASGTVLAILHVPRAPGWTATLDGRRVSLIEANLGAMAVAVPEGVHEVCWEYRPSGLWAGIMLTVAGLLACGMLARGGRRRPSLR